MDKEAVKKMFQEGLKNFLPERSLPLIVEWLTDNQVQLKVSQKRKTKLGDYRPPQRGHGHRISINGDLNEYAFLNVLVHELAHLFTWKKHQNRVQPHGIEWKQCYQRLLEPFLEAHIFPKDIQQALRSYIMNPAASSCTDTTLYKAFRKYDKAHSDDEWTAVLVEDLQAGQVFVTLSGQLFVRGDKMRKRFRCQEKNTGKWYAFSPVAEVFIPNKK